MSEMKKGIVGFLLVFFALTSSAAVLHLLEHDAFEVKSISLNASEFAPGTNVETISATVFNYLASTETANASLKLIDKTDNRVLYSEDIGLVSLSPGENTVSFTDFTLDQTWGIENPQYYFVEVEVEDYSDEENTGNNSLSKKILVRGIPQQIDIPETGTETVALVLVGAMLVFGLAKRKN